MVTLRKFEEADIPRLIGWIPDARFLLQWAGPQYKFPLDRNQLLATLETTRSGKPSHLMFAALDQQSTVVGHIELMSIDYGKKTAKLGRVLIGQPDSRGKGLGFAMVAEALSFGFDTLGLTEINLDVFDYLNHPALACYKKLGFVEYEFRKNARQIENEKWNLVMMKLRAHARPR